MKAVSTLLAAISCVLFIAPSVCAVDIDWNVDKRVSNLEHPKTAEAQPTPWPEVKKGLELLKLTDTDRLVDYGCGYDARFLIEASRYYGCRGIGLEINEVRAESAQRAVEFAGLEKWITVFHADAITTGYYEANVGVAYLYPDVLEKLKPRIEKLDRFVSYQYSVPGLVMTKVGNWHVWTKVKAKVVPVVQKPVVQTTTQWTYNMLPQGSRCQQCGSYCSSPMSHMYQKTVQVAPVPVQTVQSTTSVCADGSCTTQYCANGSCSTSGGGWYPGKFFGR